MFLFYPVFSLIEGITQESRALRMGSGQATYYMIQVGGGWLMIFPKTGETVLVTGATTEIGYELARFFAMNGYDLVMVARNEARLEQIAAAWRQEFGVRVVALAKDLVHPSGPDEIVQALEEQGIEIDVLVNNAGFGVYGPFNETSFTQELDMIQVNITAVTQLTKLLIKGMLARGKGKVLNVASTAAFQPGPWMAVYSATKAYVLSFSEALANEYKDRGITVSVLCPGPTQTEFEKRANLEQAKLFMSNLSAREVAVSAFRGLMEGKTVIIPGVKNQLFARSIRFLPRKIVTGMVHKIQAEKE